MSLYYKLYRRRHYVYLAGLFISMLFIISLLNNNKPSEGTSAVRNAGRVVDNNQNPVKGAKKAAGERINMNTYVEPPQCVGCPGENGAGVKLTVRTPFYNILVRFNPNNMSIFLFNCFL